MVIMAHAGKGIPQEDHSLSWEKEEWRVLHSWWGEQQLPRSPRVLFGGVWSIRPAPQLNLPLQIPSRETLALVVETSVWKVMGKVSTERNFSCNFKGEYFTLMQPSTRCGYRLFSWPSWRYKRKLKCFLGVAFAIGVEPQKYRLLSCFHSSPSVDKIMMCFHI